MIEDPPWVTNYDRFVRELIYWNIWPGGRDEDEPRIAPCTFVGTCRHEIRAGETFRWSRRPALGFWSYFLANCADCTARREERRVPLDS